MGAHMDRVLLADARVVSCSGDPTEQPFDGDVLIEGDRIAGVFRGGAPASTRRRSGSSTWPAPRVMPGPVRRPHPHQLAARLRLRPPRDRGDARRRARPRGGRRRPHLPALGLHAAGRRRRPQAAGRRRRPAGRSTGASSTGPACGRPATMITERGAIGAPHAHRGRRRRRDAPGRRPSSASSASRSIKLMVSGDGIVPGHPSQVTYMDDAMVGRRRRRGRGARRLRHRPRPRPRAACAWRCATACASSTTPPTSTTTPSPSSPPPATTSGCAPGCTTCGRWSRARPSRTGSPAERVEDALYPEELQASIDGLRKLHSNGVRIVAGGDFGHQWTRHGTYAAELAAYVELLGFSPLEALLTATANAGPLVGERLGPHRRGPPRRPRRRRRRPDGRRAHRCSTPSASGPWSRAASRPRCRAGAASTAGPGPGGREGPDEGCGRLRGRAAARGRGPRARAARPPRRAGAHRRQRHLPHRPHGDRRAIAAAAADRARPRGLRRRRGGRARGAPRAAAATGCWPWCRRPAGRAGRASTACPTTASVGRASSATKRFALPDGRIGRRRVRVRHVRRGDGRRRGVGDRGRDRPARRPARPARLRRDHRPRRRAQHRPCDPRVQRGRDRLRWRRPVGGPGCPHRGRGHDRGRRPVGRTPPGGPAARAPPTRSIPPRATPSSRCGR